MGGGVRVIPSAETFGEFEVDPAIIGFWKDHGLWSFSHSSFLSYRHSPLSLGNGLTLIFFFS